MNSRAATEMLQVVPPSFLRRVEDCPGSFLLFDPKPGWFRRSTEFVEAESSLLRWLSSRQGLYFVCFDEQVTIADSPHVSWDHLSRLTWRLPAGETKAQFLRFLEASTEWAIYESRSHPTSRLDELRGLNEKDGAQLCRFLKEEEISTLATPLEDGDRFLLHQASNSQ